MDPQQRLLLEVAHEALDHAGIPTDLTATHTDREDRLAPACSEYGHLGGMRDLRQTSTPGSVPAAR